MPGVLKDEMGTPTPPCGSALYAYSPVGERVFFKISRNRAKNTTLLTSLHLQIRGGMGPSMAVEGATTSRVFETYVEKVLVPSLKEGQIVVMDNLFKHIDQRGSGSSSRVGAASCALLAVLLPGAKSDRRSPLEDQAHPKEECSPHQGDTHRGDRSSVGSRERPRREGVLRSLRLPRSGAATMKGAVSTFIEAVQRAGASKIPCTGAGALKW
jgi:hypothetical protein